MASEREKMLRGELYNASDPELEAARARSRELTRLLNTGTEDRAAREVILRELFGTVGATPWIEPPFYCDYGSNITLGDNVFFNFNCVVLDVAAVTVGDRVLFGPNVQLYTATHPLDHRERARGLEFAKPISIGDDAWVGGSAVVLPGVTIGARAVIGAGSVVTRDIPPDVFAAGNPCRVVRALDG